MRDRLRLSGNTLKIIAAISMIIDHVGLMFFPEVKIFRIIGRIALPIFAFMIAEGCRYTKNKLKYFLTVFILAALCQTVYYIYDGDMYMSILVTFSISILCIYAFQFFKDTVFDNSATIGKKIISAIIFIFSILITFLLNITLEIDYGFYGCMLPLFAAFFHPPKNMPAEKYNHQTFSILTFLAFGMGLLLLALDIRENQFFSFLALPFLFLYSGKRGKYKLKYFFYIFYPVHLLLLEGLNMII